MNKQILKALPELEEQGVISVEVSDKIRDYYLKKKTDSPNRLFAIFGIFGALLVGLGLILIVAHNWDSLSKEVQLFWAFIPVLIGQGVSIYSILKQNRSTAWKESSATFLFFAIAGSLSLISQIYNLPGTLEDFVFTWMLLVIPVMYIMPSSMAALLYLIGITFLGMSWGFDRQLAWPYWPMLAALIPHYLFQQGKVNSRNFKMFNHYLIPISVMLASWAAIDALQFDAPALGALAFVLVLGILQAIGQSKWLHDESKGRNGYFILSTLGITVTLLVFSFKFIWIESVAENSSKILEEMFFSFNGFVIMGMAAILGVLFVRNQMTGQHRSEMLMQLFAPAFIAIFAFGIYLPYLALVAVNLVVLLLGLAAIREGVSKENFGILNYGLLVIAALVACRFFDSNISFVWRGVAFLLLGAGFFFANYVMYTRINSKIPNHEA